MIPTMDAPSSAERWGPLWGARARDWAENEEQQVPTYEEALRRLRPRAGPSGRRCSVHPSWGSCLSPL